MTSVERRRERVNKIMTVVREDWPKMLTRGEGVKKPEN